MVRQMLSGHFKRSVSLAIRASRAFSSDIPRVPLLINGEFVQSKSTKWLDIHNPATNEGYLP